MFIGYYGVKLSVSYFFGIVIGLLVVDLFLILLLVEWWCMCCDGLLMFVFVFDVKSWCGYFLNLLKVFDCE